MVKIENVQVWGFEGAIRGMRNPKNSWDKDDSYYDEDGYFHAGENNLKLMSTLSKAGTDHGKFMRMIHVQCDITAPVYFDSELDTYKVGTTRNSSSLQHKGASKEFTIRDFSVADERLYDILDPQAEPKNHFLIYPYDTDEYRIYSLGNREYRVYKNGKIISQPYVTNEATGRERHFPERELKPSQTPHGYYMVNLGGKNETEKWMVHRLVATVWIDRDWSQKLEVNHKDGNKGNNSVENLEWVTHQENEIHKHQNGLDGRTIHSAYLNYLASSKCDAYTKREMREMRKAGMTTTEIARLFGISQAQAYNIVEYKQSSSPYMELFEMADYWRVLIDAINNYRNRYIDTGDYNYFIQMRALMPMGYNYRFTWDANYAVLRNIYHSRKDHKLDEWHTVCEWIETLPYARELIVGERISENN